VTNVATSARLREIRRVITGNSKKTGLFFLFFFFPLNRNERRRRARDRVSRDNCSLGQRNRGEEFARGLPRACANRCARKAARSPQLFASIELSSSAPRRHSSDRSTSSLESRTHLVRSGRFARCTPNEVSSPYRALPLSSFWTFSIVINSDSETSCVAIRVNAFSCSRTRKTAAGKKDLRSGGALPSSSIFNDPSLLPLLSFARESQGALDFDTRESGERVEYSTRVLVRTIAVSKATRFQPSIEILIYFWQKIGSRLTVIGHVKAFA